MHQTHHQASEPDTTLEQPKQVADDPTAGTLPHTKPRVLPIIMGVIGVFLLLTTGVLYYVNLINKKIAAQDESIKALNTRLTDTETKLATALASGEPPPEVPVDISKVNVQGDPYIGSSDAPVTVAYWFDYQCPFCKKFEQSIMPGLIQKYVDSGKAKIVFKDFQFLGEDSIAAGLAERAVWETVPKSYLGWHQAMFEKQDNENSGWGKKADIIALTKTIAGLNATQVSKLMESNKDEYQKAMDADKAEGSGFGVSGTPSVIIGTQKIVGAQPLSTYTTIIDELLKKQ